MEEFVIPFHSDDEGDVVDKVPTKLTCEDYTAQKNTKSNCDIPVCKTQPKKVVKPHTKLVKEIIELLLGEGVTITKELENDIPTHWEKHGNMILLPGNCFNNKIWKSIEDKLWPVVCKCLNCNGVAKKDVILKDGYRTPQVTLLSGDNPWVECKENGIIYSYNITKCMFSAGNITEKMRIAKFDCSSEIVVDLYAGIGYFTLPYLVHARAQHVHACEWNPDAVHALRRNLKLNKVENRCTIYQGDNRQVCPKHVADRVNLGLIPSSEDGWSVACAAFKPTGGFLHIHHNIDTKVKVEDNIQAMDIQSDIEVCSSSKDSEPDKGASSLKDSEPDKGASSLKDSELDKGASSLKDSEPDKGRSSLVVSDKKKVWKQWAGSTCQKIYKLMSNVHPETQWRAQVCHIEYVKSYAPHVDHVVLDLECRPL